MEPPSCRPWALLLLVGAVALTPASSFLTPPNRLSTTAVDPTTPLRTKASTLLPQTLSPQVASPLYGAAGSADLDWPNLGFEFRPTRSHIKFVWKDGKWSEGELVADPYIKVHIANTGLHYGQAIFEGLKAFTHKDGSVHIFRPQENAKRLRNSAERLMMQPFPEEKFVEAVKAVVADNIEYVPPYGTGGSMYIRPLLFGSGPRIGLNPADEYTLLIMVIPVGDYYKGGMKPVPAFVLDDYDRAAPLGVGHVKVAGNYAADLLPNQLGKKKGYPIGLYLDAKTHEYIEEFSTSNFVAISKDGKFVTPDSPTVLPSITNKSLMQLAADEGVEVEKRAIPLSEVETLREVAACGTAVVVTPVNRIVFHDKVYNIGPDPEAIGPTFMKLYKRVRAIQVGEEPDKFGWNVKVR